MPPVLWVGLGSALGGASRYLAYVLMARYFAPDFPVTTLAVNVSGSLALGFFAGRGELPENVRLFLIPGICGGFTTFSTFSFDLLTLLRASEPGKAALYAAASVLVCLLGTWAGWTLSGGR
ncbi:MAG: fluoride efflux transporter CrcB [Bryobacteraceae bacterium]|nr:fluoride efflux transporter CrcB [Bryobacteraceae bacterium]